MTSLFKNKEFILFIVLISPLALNYSHASTLQSLTKQYGQPTITHRLDNGNTVYVFTVQGKLFEPPMMSNNPTLIALPGGRATAVTVPSYGQPSHSTMVQCTVVYEVNSRGALVREDRQGPGCSFSDQ